MNVVVLFNLTPHSDDVDLGISLEQNNHIFTQVDQWKPSGVTKISSAPRYGLKADTFAYWVAKKKRSQASGGGFTHVDVRGGLTSVQVDITYAKGLGFPRKCGIYP